MNQTITFEDLEMTHNGQIWLATGSFVATYSMAMAEPDVGIMHPYPEIDSYCDLDLFMSLVDEDGEELASQHIKHDNQNIIARLVKLIGEDNIYAEIQENR